MFKLVVATGAVALLAFPLMSAAQVVPVVPFSISVNPTYPTPNSVVTISVSSGGIDVTKGVFDVFLNGKHIATGTGTQPVSFETGRAGQTMQVTVVVTVNGTAHKENLTLTPEDVALAVEPLSTAPPFYQGIPTIATEGSVRLAAVPDFRTPGGKIIRAAALSYQWKIGNRTLLRQSGVGREDAIVPAPLSYRDSVVTVVVQDPSGSLIASRSVTLSTVAPVVLIYKKDPLMGVLYDHALSGNQSISGVETSFTAVPYGFSTSNSPNIVWTLGNSTAQTGDTITLRPKGKGTGSASLSVSANNSTAYESAAAGIRILFGSASGGFGLFGL